MKALTLWEPWASLVACGAKRLETRSWAPPASVVGERLIIAAAARAPRDGECPGELFRDGLGNLMYAFPRPWTEEEQVAAGLAPDGDLHAIPLHPGFVVASCIPGAGIPTVAGCSTDMRAPEHLCRSGGSLLHHRPESDPFDDGETEHVVTDQLPFGDFTPGRFGWPLREARRCDPIPAKGGQRIWEWTP